MDADSLRATARVLRRQAKKIENAAALLEATKNDGDPGDTVSLAPIRVQPMRSGPTRAILEWIRTHPTGGTASDIYASLGGSDTGIRKASVHAALSRMSRSGELDSVRSAAGTWYCAAGGRDAALRLPRDHPGLAKRVRDDPGNARARQCPNYGVKNAVRNWFEVNPTGGSALSVCECISNGSGRFSAAAVCSAVSNLKRGGVLESFSTDGRLWYYLAGHSEGAREAATGRTPLSSK